MKLQRAGSLVDVYTRGRVDGNANEIQEEGLMKYRRHRQWKYKRLGRCRRIVADRGEVAQLGRNAMTSPAGNNVETALLFFLYFKFSSEVCNAQKIENIVLRLFKSECHDQHSGKQSNVEIISISSSDDFDDL